MAPYFENPVHISEQPAIRRLEMHVTCVKYSKYNIMSPETRKECFVLCAL